MTWEIFLGIVAIIGFCVSIITPIVKLTKTISELTSNIQSLNSAMNALTINNTEAHKRIWDHNEEQDKKLDNHEYRLVKIETKIDSNKS